MPLPASRATKPEGVYWGDVPEATFEAVAPHFQPPSPQEEFNVVRYGT